MASFLRDQTLKDFQNFIGAVYSLPDDRLFSLESLLTHQQRFSMRALKGIRKGDKDKLNLLIALSWLMSVANRLHIDIEEAVWKRFSYACSYCGQAPCACKKVKPKKRQRTRRRDSLRPHTLGAFQIMFDAIYPHQGRTLEHAGVHLAEEMGEVSEAVQTFLGEHKTKQFQLVVEEMADYVSCFFGVGNSAKIDIARELEKMFRLNCHVCHKLPCVCKFSYIASFKS